MSASGTPTLACPLCHSIDFQQEEGRLDSKWGLTSHKMTLLICTNCRHILHFYDRNSIFDFD
ncbi:hypothetical protein [Allorhizocola rhizosphaerae]|uniref:hypothetical protein n=1 Tax=Allorhizocola rhizosphaerae TaxID=1872709 RepID=UPI000E3CCE96|nr:hypothetical protein [Allorhizocola rhizosphaerae]